MCRAHRKPTWDERLARTMPGRVFLFALLALPALLIGAYWGIRETFDGAGRWVRTGD